MKVNLGFSIKKLAFLMSVVLALLIIPVDSYGYEPPEYLKVAIKHGASGPAETVLESSTGFSLGRIVGGKAYLEALPLPGYTRLIAKSVNGNVELRDEAGVLISSDIGLDGCLMGYD